MSENNAGNAPAKLLRHPAVITVQPREITEAAFRALCAAGADPAEAQEGALAVLRAEADEHAGLSLIRQLLDADWTPPLRCAATATRSWTGTSSRPGGTVRDLYPREQPGLRTALQLLDLACEGPADEVSVARTTDPIPRGLWNDLLLRRTAQLQRRIVVAIPPPGNTGVEGSPTYLEVLNGTVTAVDTLPAEAPTAAQTGPDEPRATLVIRIPGAARPELQDISVPAKHLRVQEDQWHQMYQLSRNFLVPDA